MKTSLIIVSTLLISSVLAQTPKLMVIPDDIYLTKNGFIIKYDNQGQSMDFPDYDKALTNDSDLYTSIVKIQEMFAERGFELEDLKATLDKVKLDAAYTNIASNKATGSGVVQSPLDLLNAKASPDIILSLAFFVEKTGPKRQVNFNLRALDAYSLKAVASVNGIGQPSTQAVVAELVAEAVINEIPQFQDQLIQYFNKIKEEGREASFRFLLYEDAMFDFGDDCGNSGDDYIYVLEDWFTENSVNDTWELEDDSDTRLIFSAKIPVFDEKGKKVRLSRFSGKLEDLFEEMCGLEGQVKVDRKGQGEVWYFLGGS